MSKECPRTVRCDDCREPILGEGNEDLDLILCDDCAVAYAVEREGRRTDKLDYQRRNTRRQ